MGKQNAPTPPDPVVTANAQTASNKETAIANANLNRVDQSSPYGSSTYQVTGTNDDGTPKYSQTISLSPAEQGIFNNYTTGQQNLGNIALGMQGQVANSYQNPINTSGSPGVAYGTGTQAFAPQDYSAAQKQAQDANYAQQTQYLDPQYTQGQNTLDNQLANQGITRGSDAYNTAQNNFALQKQNAYSNARNSAISAGNQEQNTLYQQGASTNQQNFGQALSNANLQNTGNAQYLQQLFALRNQPLNEYNSLITGAQVQNPSFSSVPTANQANTDVAGITNSGYQNQLSAYNANNQGMNNLFSLGGSLGSAAILASDRRLKRDIVRVGMTSGGIPTYTFRYNDDPAQTYFGVMADEVMHIPGAAVLMDNGFWGVNYAVVK